jgi:hypothetical protein
MVAGVLKIRERKFWPSFRRIIELDGNYQYLDLNEVRGAVGEKSEKTFARCLKTDPPDQWTQVWKDKRRKELL